MAACQQIKWSPGGTQQLTPWMKFHGCMSANQVKPRRHTATHSLDGVSWLHVSKSSGAQEAHSNSQSGWSFMAACQQIKWSLGGTQQLTAWMEFHGCMSANQVELRRHTATHRLDGVSWLHVSNSSGGQMAHSNSHTGWSFMAACQQIKWSPGGTQQLTPWMGFHGCMSANQVEPRRHTATHRLDEISWLHVSKSSGAQEALSNSQAGWYFMAACQQIKWSPGGTHQLTLWMGFHGCMSANQVEPRKHTATHILDGVSWLHVSKLSGAQEVHNSHSRHLVNHFSVVSLKFCIQLSYYLLFMFRICFLITLNFLPFPPYHLHIQYTVKCAWYHTHILLSRLNFLTNIGSWHLHPEISVVTIFPGSGRRGLSHDSSQLQSWLQKMHSTYIPENSNVQTKMQPCKSSSPLFIWVLISLQFKWKCTTVGVSLKIFLG